MDVNRFKEMREKKSHSSDKAKKKNKHSRHYARPEAVSTVVYLGELSQVLEEPTLKRARVSEGTSVQEGARDTRKIFVPDWNITENDSVLSQGEKSIEFLRQGIPFTDFTKLHQMDVDLFDSNSMQAHLASAFYGFVSMERRKLLEKKLEEGQVIFDKMKQELVLRQKHYATMKSEFDSQAQELETLRKQCADEKARADNTEARLVEANDVIESKNVELQSVKDDLTLYGVYSAQVGYNHGLIKGKELGPEADPSLGSFSDELLEIIAPEVNDLVAKMKEDDGAAREGDANDAEDEAQE